MRIVLLVLALCSVAPLAAAQSAIDQGFTRFAEADFEGALSSFASAEEAASLTRDDVLRIYLGRALVHFALEARPDAERAIRALLSIDPAYEVPSTVAPALREVFERIRAEGRAMGVSIEARETPGGARLSAEVADPASIVRTTRLRARDPAVASEGSWVTADATELVVPGARAGVELEVEVVLVGPGGAELFTDHESVEVRRALVERVDAPAAPAIVRASSGPDVGLIAGLTIGIGVPVLAAVAILIAFFAIPANDTIIDGPHFVTP